MWVHGNPFEIQTVEFCRYGHSNGRYMSTLLEVYVGIGILPVPPVHKSTFATVVCRRRSGLSPPLEGRKGHVICTREHNRGVNRGTDGLPASFVIFCCGIFQSLGTCLLSLGTCLLPQGTCLLSRGTRFLSRCRGRSHVRLD